MKLTCSLLPFLFPNLTFTICFFPPTTHVRTSQYTYVFTRLGTSPSLVGEKFRCDVASSARIPKMGYTLGVTDAVMPWTILDAKVRMLPVFAATRIPI